MLPPCCHPLPAFGPDLRPHASPATAWYEGQTTAQSTVRLPRTVLAEAIAQRLMTQLGDPGSAGKMFGVLLVATSTGEWGVLQAFSGATAPAAIAAGWVPPIPGRDQLILAEQQTLAHLATLKQQLIAVQADPAWAALATLQHRLTQDRQALAADHREHKHQRHAQRQHLAQTCTGEALAQALAALDHQSQQDGSDRRRLKREHDQQLAPLQAQVAALTAQRRSLRQQRRAVSQALQAQMHQTYWLQNFAGQALTLDALVPQGALPTGTGDCCAPKLLHYAATHTLTPIALAEFWWGAAQGDKVPGQFYLACAERCQPIMGFLLAGLRSPAPAGLPTPTVGDEIEVLYADAAILVVHKPAGLLTGPGRYAHTQDSVLRRLQATEPGGDRLELVHRLDQATSGVLLLARDTATAKALRQQFQARHIHKRYQALVQGVDLPPHGLIELPLSPDPGDRPRQRVDFATGKPSQTHFRVLATAATYSRVEFRPITGRTHQIRIHAATGLQAPIWGDRLYGPSPVPLPTGDGLLPSDRLYLHAESLTITHPQTGAVLTWHAPPPF